MAVERLHARRPANRTERNHHRGDLHHHVEWHLEWNGRERDRRLATAPHSAAAHDDRVAAAKSRMGRHSAQRQPIMTRAPSNIRVETRLAASRCATAPAQFTSAVSGKNKDKDTDRFRRALLRWY